ncbi:MAG: hypothetical protein ACHQ5A_13945 [Opitutales bacterium]
MSVDRKNNPYFGPWRVDCRLARELPDDKPIRSHFIVQLIAVLLCAIMILIAGWQGFQLHTLRNGTAGWVRAMAEDRLLYEEVRHARADITADGRKVGEAATALQTRILAFDFLSAIGRSRPDNLRIDMIESAEGGLFLRGGVLDSPEKVSRMLGKYVTDLRADPRIGPKFSSIVLTAMDRGEAAEIHFEISFHYR